MFPTHQILAYFSPETMLPLTSLIATLAGFALLVKRSTIRFVVQCFRAAFRRWPYRSAANKPHFAKGIRQTKHNTRS